MTDMLRIKEKVKERYGKIALTGDSCCAPSVGIEVGCCAEVPPPSQSAARVAGFVGYDLGQLKSIPEASILGAGCGAPTKFALLSKGIRWLI